MMNLQRKSRGGVVSPVVITLVGLGLLLGGCRGAGGDTGQSSGGQLSGPPVFNASFQTREPRKCAKVTRPPTAAQAVALVQCHKEEISAHGLYLFKDVKVDMGSSRAFLYETDAGWPEIDTAARVYPLRGSYTGFACGVVGEAGHAAGHSCQSSSVADGKGLCWKTTFGDWQCDLGGVIGPTTFEVPPPPPTY